MNKQKKKMKKMGNFEGRAESEDCPAWKCMLVWYRIVNGADMPAWSAACYY